MKATKREKLVKIEEIALIGTTGSAPIRGTSTSGISAPVPEPPSPPITEANSATQPTSASWESETSAKPERIFTAGDRGQIAPRSGRREQRARPAPAESRRRARHLRRW